MELVTKFVLVCGIDSRGHVRPLEKQTDFAGVECKQNIILKREEQINLIIDIDSKKTLLSSCSF